MQNTTTRRSVLGGLAGLTAGLIPSPTGAAFAQEQTPTGRNWSDPSGWPGGRVPGINDEVVINDVVVLDVGARIARLEIGPQGVLIFHPRKWARLRCSGNVVVRGVLQMRPAERWFRHILRFINVDESRYVGGGMSVLESDVGLWVVEDGVLDAVGAPMTSWTRLAEGVASGALAVQVAGPRPQGWRRRDDLVIVPSLPVGEEDFATAYDEVEVASVVGSTIGLNAPLQFDHPAIPGVPAPEVMNLRRNVIIEGRPGGRAHVMFLQTRRPQTISGVLLRHLGPRQYEHSSDRFDDGVHGRYPLHFHHCRDGSRGSRLTNVVIRDSGHHGFVPHASHGITLDGCVVHRAIEDAYWWDPRENREEDINDTHDITWVNCVASAITPKVPFRGNRLAGFTIGSGAGNTIRDCVAVGVQGTKDASGFNWPEKGGGDPWISEGLVAHNNVRNGVFVWQNGNPTTVRDVVAYQNGANGIEQGAYISAYHWHDIRLIANGLTGMTLHTNGAHRGQEIHNAFVDGGGVSEHGLAFVRANLPQSAPTVIDGLTIVGTTDTAILVENDGTGGARDVQVDNASLEGVPFWFTDDVPKETEIRVSPVGGAPYVALSKRATRGTPVPEWNGRVEQ